MSDSSINTTLQERLQLLRTEQAKSQARQADLEAEIAIILSSQTSSQAHRTPTHNPLQPQQRHVPRSIPRSGISMGRHLSSDRIEKTPSLRPSPSMARTNSKGSSSGRGGNPLFPGQMPPPFSEPHRAIPVDQPWSPYTYQVQPPPLQRKPDLGQALGSVGEDPAAWIYRTGGTPSLSIAPSPIPIPSRPARGRPPFSTSPNSMPTPTTPTSGSLTNATTLTSNMSRQSSLCNDPLLESIEMMKFNSNTSFFSTDLNNADHTTSDQVIHPYASSRHGRRASNEDQSHLLKGAGGAGHNSQFLHSFPTAEDVAQFHPSNFSGEDMEKSRSNESASSSSSRSKLRLKALIQTAAARPLAPKHSGDEHAIAQSKSSQSMARFGSRDGSQDEAVVSRPSYQRPKHDRVYCRECDDHAEGFRGEHELRRHQDRQHKKMVKKWVCIQPVGLDHPKPAQPLIKCKACTHQKKKYNAYYNAAAHLRRAHFRPKAKVRTKSSKADDANKRGGKAGGDWPPMSELKHWMMEVEEQATDYPSTAQQEEELEDSDAEDADVEETSPAAMSNMAVGSFEPAPFMMSDEPFNDAFSSSMNSELFNLQGMHCLDLPQHSQQSIDSSINCSQDSFDNFSFSQNDHAAFSDLSHPFLPLQAFDDQLLGLDPVHFPPHDPF